MFANLIVFLPKLNLDFFQSAKKYFSNQWAEEALIRESRIVQRGSHSSDGRLISQSPYCNDDENDDGDDDDEEDDDGCLLKQTEHDGDGNAGHVRRLPY